MPRAYSVVGLGYGDEGKGSWVDHLVRLHGIKYVARFNGGAQASHHVVTPDGRFHGFSQFGAGTFNVGTMTLLSRFMLLEPELLLQEAEMLASKNVPGALARVIVSENAPIITPFNRFLNRIQEVYRGGSRHGSCGLGIGLTQADVEQLGERVIIARDLHNGEVLRGKLEWLWNRRVEEAKQFYSAETEDLQRRLMNIDLNYYVALYEHVSRNVQVVSDETLAAIFRGNDVVFEGAQGVLLDQSHGFFPHVTRSNCTFENVERLLSEANFEGSHTRIGLLRGYATRHGAGPLPSEASFDITPCHNQKNPWQGNFRTGWFDAVTARYALDVVNGVDQLAITNVDRLAKFDALKVCTTYSARDSSVTHTRIERLPLNYEVMRRRTEELCAVTPRFSEVPAIGLDSSGVKSYLKHLEQFLDTSIDAFSDNPSHQKIYL